MQLWAWDESNVVADAGTAVELIGKNESMHAGRDGDGQRLEIGVLPRKLHGAPVELQEPLAQIHELNRVIGISLELAVPRHAERQPFSRGLAPLVVVEPDRVHEGKIPVRWTEIDCLIDSSRPKPVPRVGVRLLACARDRALVQRVVTGGKPLACFRDKEQAFEAKGEHHGDSQQRECLRRQPAQESKPKAAQAGPGQEGENEEEEAQLGSGTQRQAVEDVVASRRGKKKDAAEDQGRQRKPHGANPDMGSSVTQGQSCGSRAVDLRANCPFRATRRAPVTPMACHII